MIDKKYNIIYLDPPWHYNARIADGRKFGRGVHDHYPTMSDDELRGLAIGKMAERNCALVMWATCPCLPLAVELIEKWGFRYATVLFVWIKQNPKKLGTFFGPGYYTGSNAELVLLGVRGSMKPVDNTISQVIIEPRMEHSHKPAIVREKIVRLFCDLPRIELFARQTASGWDGWGLDYNADSPKQEPIQNKLFEEEI